MNRKWRKESKNRQGERDRNWPTSTGKKEMSASQITKLSLLFPLVLTSSHQHIYFLDPKREREKENRTYALLLPFKIEIFFLRKLFFFSSSKIFLFLIQKLSLHVKFKTGRGRERENWVTDRQTTFNPSPSLSLPSPPISRSRQRDINSDPDPRPLQV